MLLKSTAFQTSIILQEGAAVAAVAPSLPDKNYVFDFIRRSISYYASYHLILCPFV